MQTTSIIDQVEQIWEMAEAFYFKVKIEMGEAPGQREAFDLVLEYLDIDDPAQVWHMAMLSFGLGRAETAEERALVEEEAGAFLNIGTPGDFK